MTPQGTRILHEIDGLHTFFNKGRVTNTHTHTVEHMNEPNIMCTIETFFLERESALVLKCQDKML